MSKTINEASSAGEQLFFFDRLITAIRCCRFLVPHSALPNDRDIIVAELVKKIQQHRMLRNIGDHQVSRIATVSLRLASSGEYYEAFISVCEETHKKVFLALVHFTSVTLYKIPLVEKFCSGLFAPCKRVLCGEM